MQNGKIKEDFTIENKSFLPMASNKIFTFRLGVQIGKIINGTDRYLTSAVCYIYHYIVA